MKELSVIRAVAKTPPCLQYVEATRLADSSGPSFCATLIFHCVLHVLEKNALKLLGDGVGMAFVSLLASLLQLPALCTGVVRVIGRSTLVQILEEGP